MLDPDFHPFPELETGRLLLRPLTTDDAEEILFLRSNPSVLQFLHKEPATSIKDAKDFIEEINADIDENEAIMWGIALKPDIRKLIGTVCIWQIRKEHDRAEIGYVLHPGHWKKGIMKETLVAVIDYGFSSLRLHSIYAFISPGNEGSGALLSSLGFSKEAHLKENICFRGIYEDTYIYSLLDRDWKVNH